MCKPDKYNFIGNFQIVYTLTCEVKNFQAKAFCKFNDVAVFNQKV